MGIHHEELADNRALMNVYTDKKVLKYTSLTAESRELAIPSELLLDTINFVNEHGGWTNEFRLAYMDPKTRTVRFRLFLNGLPCLYRFQFFCRNFAKVGGKSDI